MARVPSKVSRRLASRLKHFQPIVTSARARDLNESDTVTIVTDILSELFGYDKYTQLTSEHAIRGTYCDIAVKVEGKLQFLIEVKAIGTELKDRHVRQAVDYAANEGVEWTVLTNAVTWQIFRIGFTKPISHELICEFDIASLDPKNTSDLETLFLLSSEALPKSALDAYHVQRQAVSRFTLAAVILTEPVVKVIRRELKRLSPDVKIDLEKIENVLTQEVFKRDVVQGEDAEDAQRKVQRAVSKTLRKKRAKTHKTTPTEDLPATPR